MASLQGEKGEIGMTGTKVRKCLMTISLLCIKFIPFAFIFRVHKAYLDQMENQDE